MYKNINDRIKYDHEYYLKNREKILNRKKVYQKDNKAKIYSVKKKYRIKNRLKINMKLVAYMKKYILKNKEKIKNRRKEYYKKNRLEINRKQRERRKKDPVHRLHRSIRGRLTTFMFRIGKEKQCTFNDYIGCSLLELKKHIEKQFKDGMTWENHGLHGWHIDHIIPLSLAKDEPEIYKLCHYTNLQPLWAKENLSKGNKILSINTGEYFAFPSEENTEEYISSFKD